MKKRVMGRPPAEWMYRLLKMKNKPGDTYTFEELAEKLDSTAIAIRGFCTKHKIQGTYVLIGVRGVQKKISIEDLKIVTEKTVNSYFK
jgi:Zn-dependent alcohol dehydrogenase